MIPAFPQDAFPNGEMAEWLKAHAWKACVLERVPRVRIPVSPPYFQSLRLEIKPSTLSFIIGLHSDHYAVGLDASPGASRGPEAFMAPKCWIRKIPMLYPGRL